MAIRQSRRTISFNRQIFEEASEHCFHEGVTVASFAERALCAAMKRKPLPALRKVPPILRRSS